MNYRGSYKRLIGNSQAAMMAAIEIYNKPMFEYRDECTVILLLNAWELALKALLSKNKQSIFYPKKRGQPYRTLSWQHAFSKGEKYFPKTIPQSPVRKNIDFMSIYRDNAIHFYNAKDFGVVLHSLAQTSIINYRDFLKITFQIDLASQMSWQLLPIGIRPPVDIISYISGKYDGTMSSAVRQFLSELRKATNDLKESNDDTGRLMTVFDVKLESVKKIGDADVVVGIDGSFEKDGPLVVIRNQDPNKSHPLRQRDILEKIAELHGNKFTSHIFQSVIWKFDIKKRPEYFWASSDGSLAKYSNNILTFIKTLTPNEVETARKDYRQFLHGKMERRRR